MNGESSEWWREQAGRAGAPAERGTGRGTGHPTPGDARAPEGGWGTHQQQAEKGEQAVPQRPLVLALEHVRLQQLQDAQHVQEEGQVALLPELLEVEVAAAVQEGGDHGQVPGGDVCARWSWAVSPPPTPRADINLHLETTQSPLTPTSRDVLGHSPDPPSPASTRPLPLRLSSGSSRGPGCPWRHYHGVRPPALSRRAHLTATPGVGAAPGWGGEGTLTASCAHSGCRWDRPGGT